ncbi:acyl-CoA thioesterase II [Novosphingobium sp. TH158]|uniref:acyl-CoA thioesterase n=1 Tax=Novosphingobium sp. TH158 TaxID=2067455 RepID=UPI000C7D225D|nr:acyl-CoA thioesterase II [Novosphingobium sp. TH158]PLK27778.1 acyl-CoA thioesterase II [Novosphingobium sp. TH158]
MTDAPRPDDLVSELLHLLNVEQVGEDAFRGRRKVGGIGRVFGGQVIAQALASAERTVAPDREVHSLHAYFLRGGSEDHEIDFTIDRDFDGGSFSNRRVVASQQGTPILNLTASFHKREPGVGHAEGMPQVPQPEDLLSEGELREKYIHLVPENMRDFVLKFRALEVKPVDPAAWAGMKGGAPRLDTWFRAPARLPDDPHIHRAILAYASDYTLLGTCTVPHRLSWMTGEVQGASLDHAIWFHDDFRVDDWLLYSTDSPWAGRARGFNRGRIYTRDGRLVAETAQEGLIRVKPKG